MLQIPERHASKITETSASASLWRPMAGARIVISFGLGNEGPMRHFGARDELRVCLHLINIAADVYRISQVFLVYG